MERIKRIACNAIASLAVLVAGCKIQESTEVKPEMRAMDVLTQAQENICVVEVMPFAEYDPKTTQELINLEEDVRNNLEYGLGVDNLLSSNAIPIENYVAFEQLIYNEAKKLGFAQEDVEKMSPKEAAQLTCDLIARRMNYFGRTQDFRTREERRKELQIAKEIAVAAEGSISEENRERARQAEEVLQEIEKQWIVLENLEDRLSANVGRLMKRADELAIDTLYKEEKLIVCRHYATIAEGIFFVLKNKNQGLANTRVCGYVDRNHRWNQISTIYRQGDEIRTVISFFDPTSYDLRGSIEGYDYDHFPDSLLLAQRIAKLPGKKVIQPVVFTPEMRFR